MSIPTGELCDRFAQLYPGVVADSLDEMGYDDHVLPHSITPLTNEMATAGIAYPVVGEPDPSVEYDANLRRILAMLGDAPEHGVLTVESGGDTAAQLGELSTTALANRGCRGAVIDGGVRDVSFILDQSFPVFSRYRTPADAPPRWRLVDWNVPVEIGDVEVRPGDVLVGDVDGVVRVPQDVAEEVLDAAEAMADTESTVREAVEGGTDPLAAYEEFGKF